MGKDTQLARITHARKQHQSRPFPMTEPDVDAWREQFQVPDAAELGGGEIPPFHPDGQTGHNGQ